jgi:folate-dependent phosphoribosylglycinamide formyltransferase PurN
MDLKNCPIMTNKPVCVLGLWEDLYTKMVVNFLEDYKIPYELVLIKPRKRKNNMPAFLSKIIMLIQLFYTGNYIALSKKHVYTYLTAWRFMKYKKSNQYKSLINPFINIDLKNRVKFIVEDVNHVALYRLLEKKKYDIGLLAGVGIVHSEIINLFTKFCLNAHPAPLPECRGGGAIQFTLSKKLQPAASVHYATCEIDAGSILLVSEVEVLPSDNINSISDRVTIHSAEKLVEVTSLFLSGTNLSEIPNKGKLNYWKDCTIVIQKNAEEYLSLLSKNKNQIVRRWPN